MLKVLAVLFSLVLSFVFFPSKEASALTGNGFIWNKTEVTVPLYDNFEDYLDEFDVSFYYKGQVVPNAYVKVELDDMYYNDFVVSTKDVGTKQVKLIATVRGYSTYDKRDVLVHIVDEQMPMITQIKPLIITLNQKITLDEYFLIKDNYAIESAYLLDDKVNYTKLGTYPINIVAFDKSNNKIIKTYNLYIVDKEKPSIEVANFIEVNYGDEDFDLLDYVKASDNIDGDLTKLIEYDKSTLDVYKLGPQNIKVKVSDKHGNETLTEVLITVVDNEAPTVELTKYFASVQIGTKPDFKEFIKKVGDNCDKELTLDDVVIDDSEYEDTFGTYTIYYTLIDSSGNKIERKLSFSVSYNSYPIIEATDLVFKVGERFDLKDHIKVYDEYDSNLHVTIDDSVLDINTPGKYEIVITALNLAGLKSEKSIYVTIESGKSEVENIFDNIYDYIYENKMTVILLILGASGGVIYLVMRKKRHNISE